LPSQLRQDPDGPVVGRAKSPAVTAVLWAFHVPPECRSVETVRFTTAESCRTVPAERFESGLSGAARRFVVAPKALPVALSSAR
jgi:hypothetical protein